MALYPVVANPPAGWVYRDYTDEIICGYQAIQGRYTTAKYGTYDRYYIYHDPTRQRRDYSTDVCVYMGHVTITAEQAFRYANGIE